MGYKWQLTGFFQFIFPSRYACSMPQRIIPFLSFVPYAQSFPSIVGVTQPKLLSYKYLPVFSISRIPSSDKYGFTVSYTSFRLSNSPSDRGAPASPSSQQPPLHLLRSHTNCFCTTSSLTKILSIAIKLCCLLVCKYKSDIFLFVSREISHLLSHFSLQISFPFQRVNQMHHISLQKLIYNSERIRIRCSIKIQCSTQKMFG